MQTFQVTSNNEISTFSMTLHLLKLLYKQSNTVNFVLLLFHHLLLIAKTIWESLIVLGSEQREL